MDEFYALEGKRRAKQAISRNFEHAGAGIDAGHPRTGVTFKQRCEKLSVAFADKQRALHRGNFIPKRVAASLQLAACKQRLHPIIMPGDAIKSRGPRGLQGATDTAGK